MARRRAGRQHEVWSRSFEVTAVRAFVTSHIDSLRGRPPSIDTSSWLEFEGTLSEPVVGNEIHLTLSGEDDPTPGPRPSVGAVINTRPQVNVVVSVPQREFDRAWTLALSGQPKYGYIAFDQPRYGKALVRSVQLSNVAEE